MTLLLATNNAHKIEEMRAILLGVDADLRILTLNDLRSLPLEVEESGETLQENAFLKARAFFEATGLACIADDTGLEIDALNGQPGVRTARFAGENAQSSDNVQLVLHKLHDVVGPRRSARFRTVMCYVDALRCVFAEGVCEGSIAEQTRGSAGFGYDPLFIPQGYSQTFAELDSAVKNSISHRARALTSCAEKFRSLHLESAVLAEQVEQAVTVAQVSARTSTTSVLCLAASAAALNRQDVVADCVTQFVSASHDPQLLYEALLQSYLFAGFPAALESLTTLSTTLASLNVEWSAETDESYNLNRFLQRGTATCQSIYTGVYTMMRERLSIISPHLDSWMVIEGYGKTLSRPQLDLRTRELINVAMLSVCGWERQLYSHLRGALNVGATEEECQLAMNCASTLRDQEVFSRTLSVWNRVRAGKS